MCERSRLLRALLKAGDTSFILKYALRVRQQADESPQLTGFFGATDVLVPVPGSTPYRSGDLWAAEHLAVALVNEGLGGALWSGLRRIRAVRKSASAEPGKRPSVNVHYESFSMESESPAKPPDRIVLVDDVVTKGRTLLAAAIRVHEAFPCAEIRAFALVRTLGFVSGVQQLLDPCKGEIRWRAGDALRDP
jgi:predicted amidophosphoribosyltransferase